MKISLKVQNPLPPPKKKNKQKNKNKKHLTVSTVEATVET